MPVFAHDAFDDHEQVVFCRDAASGLQAIIAIHSTALGPAAGGCRMYPFATEEAALRDVLRLSRGMTYKNALAGLPLGGGKCVVIGDPLRPDKGAKLRALGRHLEALCGRYWTAVDVGIGPADADIIAETTEFVFARASQKPTDGWDTSVYTALGAFAAIEALVREVLEKGSLSGVRVAVQGVGATGQELCRLLHQAGARLVVSDVNAEAVGAVVAAYDAEAVPVDKIHAAQVDVFAPCALGGILNDATISQINAKIVCGIANNQLEAPHHGLALQDRGIIYAPDYVVNAGGIISAGRAIFATMDHAAAREQTLAIADTLLAIVTRAKAEGMATSDVADRMAAERIAAARNRPV